MRLELGPVPLAAEFVRASELIERADTSLGAFLPRGNQTHLASFPAYAAVDATGKVKCLWP